MDTWTPICAPRGVAGLALAIAKPRLAVYPLKAIDTLAAINREYSSQTTRIVVLISDEPFSSITGLLRGSQCAILAHLVSDDLTITGLAITVPCAVFTQT